MKAIALVGAVLFSGCVPGSALRQPRAGWLHPKDHMLVDVRLDTFSCRALGLSTGGLVTFCVHNDDRVTPEWWTAHVVGYPIGEPATEVWE